MFDRIVRDLLAIWLIVIGGILTVHGIVSLIK